MRDLLGWALIALGALLALPQVVSSNPWQLAFAVGVALALAGGIIVTDDRQEQ